MLKELGTGERAAVAMSTENLVSNENMLAVTSVFEHADLPLTEDTIARLAKTEAGY
jgi:hypothetical protein